MPATREDLKDFGQRLKAARERAGMTQKELADAIGKSADTVATYEVGSRQPRLNDLPKIAEALEVPIDAFFRTDPENYAGMIAHRLATVDQEKWPALAVFLKMLLDYLEFPTEEDSKQKALLVMLIFNIFDIRDYERAKDLLPDWRKG